MSDIYKYTRNPASTPLAGAGSSSAFPDPFLPSRFSSTIWAVLVGLLIISAVAAIAYLAIHSGVDDKSLRSKASAISDIVK